jgi:16S rRNA (cytosine967-C5)-methyltransferase
VKASSELAPALREAARMVARVAAGRSLDDDFAALSGDGASRAALLDITLGTLRLYGRVQAIVARLSRRGRPDPQLAALLWCALYALDSGRYANYTVVDQAVRACSLLERGSAKAYVNALLRGFLRERAAIEAQMARDPEAHYQHPGWWIELMRTAYPRQWAESLAQANRPPSMCLRVNRRREGVARYAARLAAAGVEARALDGEALLLKKPVAVQRLPGFAEGDVSVQDAGAQRAARCLELADGQRVLDACAAPGGKAGHMLEHAAIDLTAVEVDPARAARLAGNLRRLGVPARIVVADAIEFARSGAGRFDRILVDAPCSGSGIARRHPDIKWLRRHADLAAFAERQAGLLDALWRLLAPGGKLLYATCSVFPQENDAVIDAFVARVAQARRAPLADGGAAQWLPAAEHDGFYYALIEKNG